MSVKWDALTATKELAEVEWPCPDKGENVGMKDGIHTEFGYRPFQDQPHAACSGTGRIVPFASLQVGGEKHSPCVASKRCFGTASQGWVDDCQGRGWVPEPDVRVVCWEIFEKHPEIMGSMMQRPDLYGEYEVKEALFRAAQSWLKEQRS